jgi:hypothetical protein
VHKASVLDAHTDPDVRRPGEARGELGQALVPFRKDLEYVPVGLTHDCKDVGDEVVGDVFVEEVAHRVHKDRPRLSPAKWLVKTLGAKL